MKTIIERFKKISTSSVSDALDSLGIAAGLVGIQQQLVGTGCVGPAFTVEYMAYNEVPAEFRNASNYIDEVPPGAVVVIDNQGKNTCTVWGDILTTYAVHRGLAGTIVHGAVRDMATIRQLNYPLFSSHIFMQSGKNRVTKRSVGEKITISGVDIYPNDLIIADDNGCVCVPQALISEVLLRAENVEKTEERIKNAITNGMTLLDAREKFAYRTPWKTNKTYENTI